MEGTGMNPFDSGGKILGEIVRSIPQLIGVEPMTLIATPYTGKSNSQIGGRHNS